ncbi:MAG: hypothetical protein MJ224_00020 [archaeon]|nr:hypothetical protein [archaeon]
MRDFINIAIECLNQISNLKAVYYVDKANHSQTRPGETEANQLPDEDLGILSARCLELGLNPKIKFDHGEIVYFKHLNKVIALYHGNQK